MPLPQMLHAMTTTIASRAIHQLVWQLLMALDAKVMPMQMMIGPVTTGGKNRMTFCAPNRRNSWATMTYTSPAHTTPTPA